MIAIAFTFPAKRYHATPWGRHANEADVAWPPEPARVLRALIATWWRKGDHERFPKAMLDDLIDVLAVEPPLFHLPDAVHSHIRAFMPAPAEPKKLIYDAFLRLQHDAELVIAWPNVVLAPEQRQLFEHLVGLIGYLGRAEAWADAHVADHWTGEFNAGPRTSDSLPRLETIPVDVVVPLTPSAWADLRAKFFGSDPKKSNKSKRGKDMRTLIEATLPVRLADALSVDTSQWQDAGWSNPPPLQKLVYDRPVVSPLPARIHRDKRPRLSGQPGIPEVARFVLAGRPRPRIEDTLRIAEVARLALMSKFGDDRPPTELTGRNDDGPLRDDPAHAHAFYLPEDADGDGLIDHLAVYCRLGFSDPARRALDGLTALWLKHGHADGEGVRGRKEWRLALEDIAAPTAFSGSGRLLGQARVWLSVTPYLKNRFDRQRPRTFDAVIETYREQIVAEWNRRLPDMPSPRVEPLLDPANPRRFVAPVGPGRALRSTLVFTRTRGGRGGRQIDTSGGFFRLTFEKEVEGPIALGWGAHFGLGLFAAVKLI